MVTLSLRHSFDSHNFLTKKMCFSPTSCYFPYVLGIVVVTKYSYIF